MKFFKHFAAVSLIVCMLLIGAACTNYGLSTPTGYGVDVDNVLTWKSVPNARSYRVEITSLASGETQVETVRNTHYSLSGLSEGDYNIRLMAVGGSQNEVLSAWTEVLPFQKKYESGLLYKLINNNTEYEVTSVGRAIGAVRFEDTYRGKPVTSIGVGALRGSLLESVEIGKNVVSIGNSAFYNCNRMKSVTIPDSVGSIGSAAFQGCSSLEAVALPESLTELPELVFGYCRALGRVEFGENLLYIGNAAFYNCSALSSAEFPASLLEVGTSAFEGATSLASVSFTGEIEWIGNSSFRGCAALEKVEFPESCASLTVEPYAFASCASLAEIDFPEGTTELGGGVLNGAEQLARASIPDTVVRVGANAFEGTKLQNDQLAEGNFAYADKWLVAASPSFKEEVSAVTPEMFRENAVGVAAQVFLIRTADGGYSGCPLLESVELPKSVKYLGTNSFYGSPRLVKFISPAGGLTAIDSLAFQGCPVLSNVQLGEGLLTIGNYAFYNCSMLNNNMQSATTLVPESVVEIGQNAFQGTYLWENPLEEDGGVIYAGNWAVGFAQGDALSSFFGSVELRETTVGIADYAFQECLFAQVVNLNRVTHIGAGAFYGCTLLTSVSLNRNLRKIEPYTFYGCEQLYDVEFPQRLNEIGNFAFYGCSSLGALDFSRTGLETVGAGAFYLCYNVKTLEFNDEVADIGYAAFFACSQILELTIPDSVKTIGAYAFGRCEYLQKATFGSGLESIGAYAFYHTRLYRISIPGNVKTIGGFAFFNCAEAEEVTLGEGVESIGPAAFCGLTNENFTSVVLPESVRYVGDYAFRDCTFLRSAVFSDGVEYIGPHAFFGDLYATVYTSADGAAASENWSGNWNSSYRPVLWGAQLSEDGGYVVSVKAGSAQFSQAIRGYSRPMRQGYKFAGWRTEDGEIVSLDEAEEGETLYAVWEESDEPPRPEHDIVEPPEDWVPGASM